VVENYPQIKANENFSRLQDELAGTENRIATERRRYNEEVRDFNATIKRFPTNLFAGMFGFSAREYFQAAEGAEKAPQVKF
jgi:LemA protein